MRNANRIPRITGKLTALWIQNPDMRLNQLIHNVIMTSSLKRSDYDFFYTEDDEFEKVLDVQLLRHSEGHGWKDG